MQAPQREVPSQNSWATTQRYFIFNCMAAVGN